MTGPRPSLWMCRFSSKNGTHKFAPRFVPVRRRSGLMSRCGEPDKHQTLSGAASCLKIRSRSWPHSTHSKTEKVECFDQDSPHGRDRWGNGGLRTVKAAGDRTRPCGRQRSRRSLVSFRLSDFGTAALSARRWPCSSASSNRRRHTPRSRRSPLRCYPIN